MPGVAWLLIGIAIGAVVTIGFIVVQMVRTASTGEYENESEEETDMAGLTAAQATFAHVLSTEFNAGLYAALVAGTDTFSVDFTALDGQPMMVGEMSMVVLLRPKELADGMLQAMEAQRQAIVDAAAVAEKTPAAGK